MPRLFKATTLAVITTLPVAAAAQSNCAARDVVVSKLEAGYGEAFAGGGLRDSSAIYEVWMSEEKGTWTILMTRPNGTSCIMASGTNWRDALPAVKKPAGIPG